MKNEKMVMLYVLMFVMAYLIVNNPLTMKYISSTKGDTVTVVKQTGSSL